MSGIAASGMVLGCIWLLVRVVSGGEVRAHYDEGTAAERAQHFEVILFFVLAAATSAACLAAFTLFRKSELLSYYRDRQSRVPNARHSLQAHIVGECARHDPHFPYACKAATPVTFDEVRALLGKARVGDAGGDLIAIPVNEGTCGGLEGRHFVLASERRVHDQYSSESMMVRTR